MNDKKINFPAGRDGYSQALPNFSKQVLLKGMIVLFLAVALLILHACENPKSMKERESMVMAKINSTPKATKPPIDASRPVETEMATFALG